MKKVLLTAAFIVMVCFSSFAQNYISGIVSLHSESTASGTTVVGPKGTLTLYKNKFYEQAGFVNRGDSTAISADSGTLVMSGKGSQGITGRFKISALQVSNNSGVLVSNVISPTMVTILDSVTFSNINNGELNAGDGLLTLRSNEANTARIADLTNNASNRGNIVSGKVVVERYVRSRRTWHLLAPPTTADSVNDQTIQAAWQEGVQAPRGQIVDPHPGYGTVITRPGSNPASATGYDDGIAASSAYSMKAYYSNGLFTPPVNTDLTHFSPHAAYFLFVRGDRSVGPELQTNTNQTPSTITTLRSKGTLHNGDVIDTVTKVSGDFSGISNPYACTVDFSKVTLNGVTNGFYTWDPSINAYGAWVYIDGDDNYNATPFSPLGGYTNPAINSLIQSGQGIVVKAIGSSGTVTFKESNKNITSRVEVFRVGALPSLHVNLFSKDSSHTFMDGATAVFDASFSKQALPDEDINKPGNVNENLSFFATSQYLIKEKWPMPEQNDTLPLRLWKTTARKYSFSIDLKDLDGATQAYLWDNYTKSNTAIGLGSTTGYDFEITSDSASKAIGRFAVVFGSKALPVSLTQIKAVWDGTLVNVQWTVHNETDISSYDVERSTDGVSFTKIGTVAAHDNPTASDAYSFGDAQPADGNNFYRIKIVSQNGTYTYTSVVSVSITAGKAMITMYQNPVKNGLIKLWFKNENAGKYLVQLYGTDGKMIFSKAISHLGGTTVYTLPAGVIAQGLYHAVINKEGNVVTNLPVIIE